MLEKTKPYLVNTHKFSSWSGRILEYNTLPSTNTFILDKLEEFKNMDVVWTRHQTCGRGRYGRNWITPKNTALTFSILLKINNQKKNSSPHELLQKSFSLPQVIAYSMSKVFHQFGMITTLKWPNDILYQGKKLGGILAESKWKNGEFFLVIGIGINLHLKKDQIKSINQKITALSNHLEVSNKWNNPLNLLEIFLIYFLPAWRIWEEKGFAFFVNSWKKQSDLIGREVVLIINQVKEEVRVMDIDEEGFLIVREIVGGHTLSEDKKISFGEFGEITS